MDNEELLELANCVSDLPLISLSEDSAFEPLIALLHASILFEDADTDEQSRVIIATHLLAFGSSALKPLIDYIAHEPEGDYLSHLFKFYPVTEHLRNTSRSAIALLLSSHGDEIILPNLLDLLHVTVVDNDPVYRNIIRVAIQLNPEDAILALSEILMNHESPYARRLIIEVFGEYPFRGTLLPIILSLKDPFAFVAKSAVQVLGIIKSPDAFPFLIEVLDDFRYVEIRVIDDPYVALTAIEVLDDYQTPTANQIIFDCCIRHLQSTDFYILRRVIKKLGKLRNKRAIPYLTDALNSDHIKNHTDWQAIEQFLKQALGSIQNTTLK